MKHAKIAAFAACAVGGAYLAWRWSAMSKPKPVEAMPEPMPEPLPLPEATPKKKVQGRTIQASTIVGNIETVRLAPVANPFTVFQASPEVPLPLLPVSTSIANRASGFVAPLVDLFQPTTAVNTPYGVIQAREGETVAQATARYLLTHPDVRAAHGL